MTNNETLPDNNVVAAEITMPTGTGREPIFQSLKRLWCPQHAEMVKKDILDLVGSALKTIDVGIYGFAWKPLCEKLIEKHQAGVKVRIVFDRTQSAGMGERDLVAEVIKAGIECYVGTSPRHAIRHTKDIVVDSIAGEMGSLNYSESGFKQNNTVEVFYDAGLAQYIIADLEDNIEWLVANEPQWNTPVGHPVLPAPKVKVKVEGKLL
jgi:phosphatidylserine/phosphatidylglycerophosphate/cardiolipin synthase-like enzyme